MKKSSTYPLPALWNVYEFIPNPTQQQIDEVIGGYDILLEQNLISKKDYDAKIIELNQKVI